MAQEKKPALERLRTRRRWMLAGGVIAFAWALRAFVTIITPDNPNPYITPLAVLTTVLAVLAPLVHSARFGRSRMADVTLVLGSVLVASGAALQFGPGAGDARIILLAGHLIGGVLVLLPVHLYLVGHLGDALRRRPVTLVWSGVGSLAVLLACVWTGVLITFVQAREMEPLAIPHAVTAWALVALCLLHVPRGRDALAQRETPPPARRRFLVEGVLPGVALVVLAAGIGVATPDAGPWEAAAGPLPADQGTLTQARTAHDGLLSGDARNWEPATCSSGGGYCHVDNVTQWKRSAHARSSNPAYQAALKRFEETRPGKSAYCAGCHEPRTALSTGEYGEPPTPPTRPLQTLSIGVDGAFVSDGATGEATTIPPVPPGELGEGVGCQVCHRARPREGDEGHTSGYVLSPLPADFARTAAVPFFNFPMILSDLDRHREQFLGDMVLGDVDGCATCHVHHVPDAVHPGVPGLVAADHRTQFADSAEFADGKTCVHCHMPRTLGPLDPTETLSHSFPSSNTGVPWLLGLPERVAENQAFLRDEKLEMELACERVAGPEQPSVACRVTIENVGVGHDYPAGMPDVAEVWVELVAESGGQILAELGRVDEAGDVIEPAVTFRQRYYDAEDRRLDLHEFWLVTRVEGIGGIPTGDALTTEPITLPHADGPISVKARLRHRRYNADFIRAAFGPEHALAPITDIVEAETTLP